MDVTAQSVELGTDDRGLGLARPLDRRIQLRPVIVSAAFGLGEGLNQVERLAANREIAARCASRPSPDRPCRMSRLGCSRLLSASCVPVNRARDMSTPLSHCGMSC